MPRVSAVSGKSGHKNPGLRKHKADSGVIQQGSKLLGVPKLLKDRLMSELHTYFGGISNPDFATLSWSNSVIARWDVLNIAKNKDELGILSWNVNGRLELRGCRESLLRRWALNGFVDVGLVQEHFKKDDSPLFDLFGSEWWNI